MHPETPGPDAPPPQFSTPTADAAERVRICDAACSTWQRIDAALSPIIGHKGVLALYRRSLHVAGVEHPCLKAAHQDSPGEFDALRAALAQPPVAGAAAAQDALLRTFRDLLSSLIGASLTERLLQPVWGPPSSGTALQDTMP